MKVACISCKIPFWQNKDESLCPFCCPNDKSDKRKNDNRHLNRSKKYSEN